MNSRKIIFCLLLSLLMLGCSNQLSPNDLLGKWKITDYKTTAQISLSIIKSAREIALSVSYDLLSEDGLIYRDYSVPDGTEGTWKINIETNEIELNYNVRGFKGGGHYQITEFTTSKMIWKHDMGELGIEEFTLEKVD